MWSVGRRLGALLAVLLAALLAGAGTAQAQTTTELTINPVATFNPATANVTVTGTYACGDLSGAGLIEVTLGQQVGRVATVTGYGFADIVCEPGASGTWSAEIVASGGEFRGGPAFASARLVIEGVAYAETGVTVRVHGSARA